MFLPVSSPDDDTAGTAGDDSFKAYDDNGPLLGVVLYN